MEASSVNQTQRPSRTVLLVYSHLYRRTSLKMNVASGRPVATVCTRVWKMNIPVWFLSKSMAKIYSYSVSNVGFLWIYKGLHANSMSSANQSIAYCLSNQQIANQTVGSGYYGSARYSVNSWFQSCPVYRPILTEIFRRFLQDLKANYKVAPQVIQSQIPFRTFTVHYTVMTRLQVCLNSFLSENFQLFVHISPNTPPYNMCSWNRVVD
jgi:hypothetical protein